MWIAESLLCDDRTDKFMAEIGSLSCVLQFYASLTGNGSTDSERNLDKASELLKNDEFFIGVFYFEDLS